jgi:hypothetical protein
LLPGVEKVKETGAVADHPPPAAGGALGVSVTTYPVTPTLSVAVKVLIGTLSVVAVTGTVKAVTVGGVASTGAATRKTTSTQ